MNNLQFFNNPNSQNVPIFFPQNPMNPVQNYQDNQQRQTNQNQQQLQQEINQCSQDQKPRFFPRKTKSDNSINHQEQIINVIREERKENDNLTQFQQQDQPDMKKKPSKNNQQNRKNIQKNPQTKSYINKLNSQENKYSNKVQNVDISSNTNNSNNHNNLMKNNNKVNQIDINDSSDLSTRQFGQCQHNKSDGNFQENENDDLSVFTPPSQLDPVQQQQQNLNNAYQVRRNFAFSVQDAINESIIINAGVLFVSLIKIVVSINVIYGEDNNVLCSSDIQNWLFLMLFYDIYNSITILVLMYNIYAAHPLSFFQRNSLQLLLHRTNQFQQQQQQQDQQQQQQQNQNIGHQDYNFDNPIIEECKFEQLSNSSYDMESSLNKKLLKNDDQSQNSVEQQYQFPQKNKNLNKQQNNKQNYYQNPSYFSAQKSKEQSSPKNKDLEDEEHKTEEQKQTINLNNSSPKRKPRKCSNNQMQGNSLQNFRMRKQSNISFSQQDEISSKVSQVYSEVSNSYINQELINSIQQEDFDLEKYSRSSINGYHVNRKAETKNKFIKPLNYAGKLFYFLIFLYGNFVLYNIDLDCQNQAPHQYYVAVVYLILGYIYLGIPLFLITSMCLCLPILLVLYFFIRRRQDVNWNPANKEFIKNLDRKKFSPEVIGKSLHTECCICLAEYTQNDELIVLPCNKLHHFHSKCIVEWLENNGVCPICKSDLSQYYQELQEI